MIVLLLSLLLLTCPCWSLESVSLDRSLTHRLEVSISSPDVFETQTLSCTSPLPLVECEWFRPSSKSPYQGVVQQISNNQSSYTCSIQVQYASSSINAGIWTCRTRALYDKSFQEAYVTLPSSLIRVQDVFLPTHLSPIHYDVFLDPELQPDFGIRGHVDLELEVVTQGVVLNITLHASHMSIDEPKVRVLDLTLGKEVEVIGFGYDERRDFLVLHLSSRSFFRGEKLRVSVEFKGDLSNGLDGFYRSSYVDKRSKEQRILATTHFESTDARRAFPCMDEPSLKAVFRIHLRRDLRLDSISNALIAQRAIKELRDVRLFYEQDGSKVWDIYEQSVPMSTYLLAFVVSDFVFRRSSNVEKVDFRIWSRGDALNQTEYASDIGPRILSFYEDLFEVSFPLAKMDLIAIPDFAAGAMENWGLVTFREQRILYDEIRSSLLDRESATTVIAHELAHQWFGNLVTMKWWKDIWLNEGFATFVEHVGANFIEPRSVLKERFVVDALQIAMDLDALDSSHPVSVDVAHPDEIAELFDDISYEKGASIIRMMAAFIGEERFFEGLSQYLRRFAYSNAEQDDLWTELEKVAVLDSASMKAIMDTWTLQQGFPVVTIEVERDTEGHLLSLSLSQRRFRLSSEEEEDESEWFIPLTLTTVQDDFNDTSVAFWMHPNKSYTAIQVAKVANKRSALVANVQETGFYRVNYDRNNWLLLIDQLKSNLESLNRVNRAQLLNDALNLARVGAIDYNTVLSLVSYLVNERDLLPWTSALRDLDYLKRMLDNEPVVNELMNSFMLWLMEPTKQELGLVPDRSGDKYLDIILKAKVAEALCGLEEAGCVAMASELFGEWLENEDTIIVPDIKATVLCTGIANSDVDTWTLMWQRMLKADVEDRGDYLQALACSRSSEVLVGYLDEVLETNSAIRAQDGRSVITYVAEASQMGTQLAWTWINRHWEAIVNKFSDGASSDAGAIVAAVTKNFNTEMQLDAFETFFDTNQASLAAARKEVLQALENVKINVQWKDKFAHDVAAFLFQWGQQELQNEH